MTIYVFTGPTLSAEEGRAELDAVFLPPAAQGDVYRAALENPTAIGIIDGYFERIPSVAHKEILWAMSQGIHVFGAASMGALRAAELSLYGMEGVGAIYEAYHSGELEADDEVALAHALAEDGYRPSSEAMVNIRATLAAAEGAGVLCAETHGSLLRIAKDLFYPDRCYPIVLTQAAREGVPLGEIEALRAFLPHGRVNQKRFDALALLRVLRERFMGPTMAEPKRVTWHFEATDAWEHVRTKATSRGALAPSTDAATGSLLEELKLTGGLAEARRGAMIRGMAIEVARRQNRVVGAPVLQDAADVFRGARGLVQPEDAQRWLADQGITDIERFFRDEAYVQWAEVAFGGEGERRLVDHLRSTGEYAALAGRAREKEQALATRGEGAAIPRDELLRWYFVERRGTAVPVDVARHAQEAGFAGEEAFLASLAREHRYLDVDAG